jgi:hypothetical protein
MDCMTRFSPTHLYDFVFCIFRSLLSDLSENISALDLASFQDPGSRRDLFGERINSRRDVFEGNAEPANRRADMSFAGLSMNESSRNDSFR